MSIALLVAVCLSAGLAIRLIRRWPRIVFWVISVGIFFLFAILTISSSEPIDFIGRTFTLDSGARLYLFPAMGIAGVLALFTALTFERADDSPFTVILNSQAAFFFWSLAALVLAIALDSFPLATFFWAIGLIVLMFLARSEREGRAGGAAQFLLLIVVAVACLLVSNRFFESYPLAPENLDLARSAVLFLAWGLGLLLAVAPLQVWLGALAEEMTPLGTAFLVAVAQPVGLWLLLDRMSQFLWLTEKSPLLIVLMYAGVFTILAGAWLALAERRDARFIAYLSLVPLGHALIGLGLGTRIGLAGAILMLFNRGIGVALMAGGLTFVRYHRERRWQIVGAFAILIGGISLAGIPPSPGAVSLWAIYRDLASTNLFLVALLFASNAIALIVVVRLVWSILAQPVTEPESRELKVVPYLCAGIVAILFIVVVTLGIFPQLASVPILASLGGADYLK